MIILTNAFFGQFHRSDDVPKFRVSGLISTCNHGQGRSSNDRQFYFVNGRPVDPNKLMKVINEIYHQLNRSEIQQMWVRFNKVELEMIFC